MCSVRKAVKRVSSSLIEWSRNRRHHSTAIVGDRQVALCDITLVRTAIRGIALLRTALLVNNIEWADDHLGEGWYLKIPCSTSRTL